MASPGPGTCNGDVTGLPRRAGGSTTMPSGKSSPTSMPPERIGEPLDRRFSAADQASIAFAGASPTDLRDCGAYPERAAHLSDFNAFKDAGDAGAGDETGRTTVTTMEVSHVDRHQTQLPPSGWRRGRLARRLLSADNTGARCLLRRAWASSARPSHRADGPAKDWRSCAGSSGKPPTANCPLRPAGRILCRSWPATSGRP
jgi:hypothetical protein